MVSLSKSDQDWLENTVDDVMFRFVNDKSIEARDVKGLGRAEIERRIRRKFKRKGAFGSIISSILISIAIRIAIKLIEKWIQERLDVFE